MGRGNKLTYCHRARWRVRMHEAAQPSRAIPYVVAPDDSEGKNSPQSMWPGTGPGGQPP